MEYKKKFENFQMEKKNLKIFNYYMKIISKI